MVDLPDGWERISLGDLGEWRGGGTPSKSNLSYWQDGTIPWISPKDMKRDKIDSAEDMITREAVENSSAALIPSGSLLLVTRSGILRHSLPVAGNTIPVAINQDIKALTLLPGLDADFFRYQINSAAPQILSDKRKGIQLTVELEEYINALKCAATCWNYDAGKEIYTFDMFVDEQMKFAISQYFKSSILLYRAFHKLALLNDLAIPKAARDRLEREIETRRFASRLPEPQDEDKVSLVSPEQGATA